MKIVYQGGEEEIVEKKSRFIATVRPISSEEEAAAFVNEMKKKYWDARHNCSAFTLGEHHETCRCSDDGEPSQTAGRPMQDVLLKEYIHNITDWNIEDENNKPRDLLQKLSSELIKGKLGLENIFINRQIEDIKIYSYFKDAIIINDVRFPKEIDTIKNVFTNVVSIQVKRSNYISGLTKEQLQDVTETSLDNYNNFDYIIENDDIELLKEDTINIFKSIQKRGESNE